MKDLQILDINALSLMGHFICLLKHLRMTAMHSARKRKRKMYLSLLRMDLDVRDGYAYHTVLTKK